VEAGVLYLVFRFGARFEAGRAVDALRLDAVLPEPFVRVEVFGKDALFGAGSVAVGTTGWEGVCPVRNARNFAFPATFDVQRRMYLSMFHPLSPL